MLEERNFKTDLFAQYPNQQQIAWPRLDLVKLDLKDLTFHSIEKSTLNCLNFESCGYSTARDQHFSGTMVPMKHYRKDHRVRSLMI